MWGSFVFVWYVVFNQGCCVFIQFNLFKGCCEWILIQPWTQVTDYSLPELTWHTRLRIGISHLSMSGIVIHSRCYISHCFYFSVIFYDCLLVSLSLLFLFSCLSDSSLSSQESILTCLLLFWFSDWSLNFIIFVMVLIDHIIVYYITKLHYSRLLYLIMSWLLFSIVFIILFLFLFYFSISFTFTLQILFDLVLHLLFYLVFVLLYLFIPRNPLSQKCGEKTNSFILFFL